MPADQFTIDRSFSGNAAKETQGNQSAGSTRRSIIGCLPGQGDQCFDSRFFDQRFVAGRIKKLRGRSNSPKIVARPVFTDVATDDGECLATVRRSPEAARVAIKGSIEHR